MAAARTGTVPTAGAATESEFSSAAQRERRQRSLDATLMLASRGGYEAVPMRAVADRAGVALGTLYRYFPSKVHLLVSGWPASSSGTRRSSTAWRFPALPARRPGRFTPALGCNAF